MTGRHYHVLIAFSPGQPSKPWKANGRPGDSNQSLELRQVSLTISTGTTLAWTMIGLIAGVAALLPAWWIANRQRVHWQTKALTDELTGLANRRHLIRTLHRMADTSRAVAVILLDLDGFKQVNDIGGHGAGDDLLRAVADRLNRIEHRHLHTIARLGGDEYAIVIDNPDSAADIADAIAQALAGTPVSLGWGHLASAAASIGVTVGEAGAQPRLLLHQADAAMYQAKRAGGAQIRMFTPAATEPGLVERPAVRQRDRRHDTVELPCVDS
ncbi:hypothetical protein GCM10010124_25160 [Pilimelia terevasa]|uniref:GGDEF domain-containing protein n=1 Tax=Pilimelia terevasa TaxID=53372 RepID=A0A8J3BM37_9ACTN|nr:GGDEF domain-containing protein [Pilimelia terevasa]GGK31385.1 hypothetical protein GCM10010124_25160 [Pilimelia terevasa]